MLPENLSIALKEWAVVERSLREGHQLILLRKGGLIEETGDFDLKSENFLLYPTYEHQSERLGDLQQCFRQWREEEEARKPPRDQVRIQTAAHVTDIIRVEDRARLLQFAPQHIWSEAFIHGRYDWEPYKPIFLLLLRTYLLPEPHLIPVRSEYGGCRSWVELAEPISTGGAVPAVSEERFARRRELTLSLLSESN